MELDFVRWLDGRLPALAAGQIGVGDDAALLALQRPELVATADLLLDGVHFDSGEHVPERIGRKALAVNLSDLAAMAARPAGALVSLALPRRGVAGRPVDEVARRLLEGMQPLAEEFDCPIVGGDTNTHDGPLVVSVAAFGTPTHRGVVRRTGARPGDWLMVTGNGLGGSLAGKHLDFTPRVAEALRLVELVDLHAMMDLSDGLSLDLRRMGDASGVGAVVDADRVPISDAARRAAAISGRDPLDHALCDGEDFELLLAAGPEAARTLLTGEPLSCGLVHLGEIVADPGLSLRRGDGSQTPLLARGYEHR